MYLFVDTTNDITLGLLNDKFEWLEYKFLESKKSSAELHYLVYELLLEFNLEVSGLTAVIYCAGPGSYTGMRVSAGMTDILGSSGVKVNSFYHFNVPELLDVKEGCWVAKAFKGEYFLYKWNLGRCERLKKLIPEKTLLNETEDVNCYAGVAVPGLDQLILTRELIKSEPFKIFSKVINNNTVEDLYYYRPLEEEFSRK